MLAGRQDVFANQPITRLNLIEPGKPPPIGMAAIAILFQNLMNVRRHLDFGSSRLGRDTWMRALKDDKSSRTRDGQLP